MVHPVKWYPIHVAKTGKLRDYQGREIKSLSDFTKLTTETFRKHGVVNGFKSMLFEKMFPLFARWQLPKTIEFWKERWYKLEQAFEESIEKRKKIRVFEIGCGSGDLLINGALYAKEKGIDFKGIGIDIDPDAIQFAQGYSESLYFPNLEFYVGDAIKGTLQTKNQQMSFNKFVKQKFGRRPDLVLMEGVIEWLRDFQDPLLKTTFDLKAEEYLMLAASQKAVESKGGRIISGIAKLNGEEVKGFTEDELKKLLKKHAGDKKISIEICGGEWYPEGFYVAKIE